jgi:pyruvate dehydrogenase E2 component (dihydrolipoamide acetyltransferase)
MATNILMPALSPTMTEGTLARWLKKEGDTVKAGDVIAEIETDKATMEVEAVDEGVLGKILVGDGTTGVKVNDPIAVLVAEGESVPAGDATPAAAPAPQTAPGKTNGHAGEERVVASPLARRMAKQAGIGLAGLKGSGPSGRIVKADIEATRRGGARPAPAETPVVAAPIAAPVVVPVAAAAVAAPVPAPKPAAPPVAAPHRLVANSTVRKVIARRLTEAKQTIPHFYVSIDVELDALLKLRAQLNAKSPSEGPAAFKLSVNDLLIKAAAVTLRRLPGVNSSYTDEAIVLYDDVDISVAVSITDGLITPIIRKADQKGLAAISAEMKDLAKRARAGKLKPEEFQGGSFTISNMGMYGISEFAAIINPPQAGILAVAAGEPRPVVKDGALAIATVMTCTLSVDHRVVDGALGAQWLAEFKKIVEAPLNLML